MLEDDQKSYALRSCELLRVAHGSRVEDGRVGNERLFSIEDLKNDFIVHNGRVYRSAGTIANGYRLIKYKGKAIWEHRLVFTLDNGRFPNGEVDHIDGNRSNNAPDNLRESSKSQNLTNRHGKNNTSGVNGISFDGRRNSWKVYNSEKFIGYFAELEDAIMARWKSEDDMSFPSGNRGRYFVENQDRYEIKVGL